MHRRNPAYYKLAGSLLLIALWIIGTTSLPPNALARVAAIFAKEPNNVSCPSTLTVGETIVCSIDAKGEEDKYSFSATQGDKMKAVLVRASGTLDPAIHILDSAGNQICIDFTSGNVAEIISCTLSKTDLYTIVVDDTYETNTGGYVLFSQRLNNPINAAVLNFTQPITSTISTVSEFDSYAVQAVAGASVKVTMTVTEGVIRPRIRIYDLKGVSLCVVFSSAATVEISECTLPDTGVYAMLVDGASDSRTGSYTLLLECLAIKCSSASIFAPIVRR